MNLPGGITARVNAAVAAGMSDDAAFRARRAAIAVIEKESPPSLRSEVVTLYQGAEYQLYRYKRYTDVRLVFSPEEQIAFYGGDPDNFEYPRYDLDICLFRAYENGQPAHVDHYLKWSQAGPAEGDLVFVSGHPGRTDRLRTMAELRFLRDVEYPRSLERLKRLEVLLGAYSARSAENARRARNDLFSARNSRKVRDGALAGLLDPQLMQAKKTAEEQLRASVAGNPDFAEARGAWDRIATAQKEVAQRSSEYEMLERNYGFNSALFTYARQLLRASRERSEPEGERLEEFRDSARPSFELELFAQTPIYEDLESLKLEDSLTWLAETLGADQPLVQKVLAGKSPRERARELVHGTRLASPALRREYYQGGAQALDDARDPMVELARLIDPRARDLRREVDVRREAIRQAHAQIGKARYILNGASQYPDATSTLRLAFGVVKGYAQEGRVIPSQTTFSGLYQRAAEQDSGRPLICPNAGLMRSGNSIWQLRSISSAPPTSSAATPAAPPSIGTGNSWASSSTGTFNPSSPISTTPKTNAAPFASTPRVSSRRSRRCIMPKHWSGNWWGSKAAVRNKGINLPVLLPPGSSARALQDTR